MRRNHLTSLSPLVLVVALLPGCDRGGGRRVGGPGQNPGTRLPDPNAPPIRTQIRIHNASGVVLASLRVGVELYGDLGPGEYTEYREFVNAYPTHFVEAEVGHETLRIVPFDHNSEQRLAEGSYAYEIDVVLDPIRGPKLTIEVTRE